MDKFCGKVLFEIQEEEDDGVFVPKTTLRTYKGDVFKNQIGFNSSNNTTNDDLKVQHRISIIQDGYLLNNCSLIKAVEFMGTFWEVTNVEYLRPRLILSIGGVYNGFEEKTS